MMKDDGRGVGMVLVFGDPGIVECKGLWEGETWWRRSFDE